MAPVERMSALQAPPMPLWQPQPDGGAVPTVPVSLEGNAPVSPAPVDPSPPEAAASARVTRPPSTADLQMPFLHLPPAQDAPSALAARCEQVGLPMPQTRVPFMQPSGVVQGTPAVQVAQEPALHTPPVHIVPSALSLNPVQVAPPEQETVPAWQPFSESQEAPEVQEVQTPAWQVPVPLQAVPFVALTQVPHSGWPLPQAIFPVWQPSTEVHRALAVHSSR